MSNVVSDNLHKLIRSMTKAEKRYFKIFSSRHILGDENNYRLLFAAIDKQEVYDEDRLVKKFSDKQFTHRFSISKNRLYNAILKSLDAFHSNSSVEAQLNRQIHSAEILYHKSLYDQSLKLLNSARKVAEKYEKYPQVLSIIRWEKRIIEKSNYAGVSVRDLETIATVDRALAQKIAAFDELWNVKSRVFHSLFSKGKVRSGLEEKEFKAMLDELKLNVPVDEQGIENQYLMNHVQGAFYFAVGKYEECYPYLLSNISLIEEYPHLFDEEPGMYLSVLSNAVYVGLRLSKPEEARKNLDRLRKFPKVLESQMNTDLEARVFSTIKSTELTLFAHTNDFEQGMALLPDIEKGLDHFGTQVSPVKRAQLLFNSGVICIGAEKFHDALRFINQLLNDSEIDSSLDIHCMARMLDLVIHLELGHRDLLPYTLRSSQRYLQVRQRVFQFEKVFLDFINEYLKKRQGKKEPELFSELIEKMEELKKDAFEAPVFEYFDFIAWAKNHVTGKPYRKELAA